MGNLSAEPGRMPLVLGASCCPGTMALSRVTHAFQNSGNACLHVKHQVEHTLTTPRFTVVFLQACRYWGSLHEFVLMVLIMLVCLVQACSATPPAFLGARFAFHCFNPRLTMLNAYFIDIHLCRLAYGPRARSCVCKWWVAGRWTGHRRFCFQSRYEIIDFPKDALQCSSHASNNGSSPIADHREMLKPRAAVPPPFACANK